MTETVGRRREALGRADRSSGPRASIRLKEVTMSWLNRLATILRLERLDAEIDEELGFHIEERVEQYVAQGMPHEQAQLEARRALGGRDRAIEACRDADRIAWVENIWRDLRYAFRTLRASPLFTLTTILSLALGIGANTAVFTLLHATLWKPLPVPEPDRLVGLVRADPKTAASHNGGGFSYVLFRQVAEAAKPFGEVTAKSNFELRKFGMHASSTERVVGEALSGNFFSVVEVNAALGRLFTHEDDKGNQVAVLSHAFWIRRFEGDPAVLGKTIFYKETP